MAYSRCSLDRSYNTSIHTQSILWGAIIKRVSDGGGHQPWIHTRDNRPIQGAALVKPRDLHLARKDCRPSKACPLFFYGYDKCASWASLNLERVQHASYFDTPAQKGSSLIAYKNPKGKFRTADKNKLPDIIVCYTLRAKLSAVPILCLNVVE